MNPVLVRGDGVAAYCCVHLLRQAGIPAVLDRPSRPRLPAIMLSEPAVHLIADVFGHERLFADLPRIQNRSVLWGPGATPVKLPHSAVVVSEERLLDCLRPPARREEIPQGSQWNVYAARPLPEGVVERRFGSRTAHASAVGLRNSGPGCWTESTENGWLFLIGNPDREGWLLSVGGEPDALLASSKLVAEHIGSLESLGEFVCSPRIVAPLCGRTGDVSWFACGTAAIGFDPICGDGTAFAVREAILATAGIRAIAAGAPAESIWAHYESRLTAGFQRHLENCIGFYRTGGSSPWWTAEREAAQQGIAWCAARMASFPPFRYRLNGFELETLA